MANVAIFKTGKEPQYLQSVNTPEYASDPDVIVNPDITAVQVVPLKFWKRVGNAIAEMTAGEKQAILDAELLARKSAADNFTANAVAIFTALIKVINVRLPAGQKITKQELIDAIKLEVT